MIKRDFWHKATIAVVGGGSWGTVLANLAARNCADVRMWVRSEERTRQINATRVNADYIPDMTLDKKVLALSDLDRVFEGEIAAVIWVLPARVCREEARAMARYFTGSEILIHATKGIEERTLQRISTVLAEELPCPRIGVISGPNLAGEIARGEPAATVVASEFDDVIEAGQALFATENFAVVTGRDVVGVEWAGTLKNVLAIAAGVLDGLGLGWNARAMLISRGLEEMVRFGVAMGARGETFLGLAGVGDLLATCSSPLSRNYRVGQGLAQKRTLGEILEGLGSTAEGVSTARAVWAFARERQIHMPVTESVCRILDGDWDVGEAIRYLME